MSFLSRFFIFDDFDVYVKVSDPVARDAVAQTAAAAAAYFVTVDVHHEQQRIGLLSLTQRAWNSPSERVLVQDNPIHQAPAQFGRDCACGKSA